MEGKFIKLVPAKQLVDMLPKTAGEAKFISNLMNKCRSWYRTAEKQLDAANKAKNEDETSKPLIAYLEKIFEGFPNESRPCVADTHRTVFASIIPEEHKTMPDASNGRPGASIAAIKKGWPNVGLVIEFKLKTDFFDKDGKIKQGAEARRAARQLGKSARSLLAIHGGCHVYVIAVFEGRKTRIFRFDRGGFIATHVFDWLADQKLIPTFFYRLYNAEPGQMHGDDDTISVLSDEVKQKLFDRLQETEHYKAAVVNCLSFGTPLAAADGLFGRATNVYRVVLEEDLENAEKPLSFLALKDSWRQACRRPELDFYDAIEHYCLNAEPPVDMEGMARCCGSVDLAEPSSDLIPDWDLNDPDWDSDLHCTVFLGRTRFNRHHMRTLLTPVGAPLKSFKSQEDLCRALYSVVLHLEIAYKAGVLHRDVSEGNVLLQETSLDKGFLLDWDYAEFTPEGLEKFHAAFENRAKESDNYQNVRKSLKDVTGTEPFMAIEILKASATQALAKLNTEDDNDDDADANDADANDADAGDNANDADASDAEDNDNDANDADENENDADKNNVDETSQGGVDGEAENSKMGDAAGDDSEGTFVGDGMQGVQQVATVEMEGASTALTHGLHHDLESVYWLLIWMILRHTQHGHRAGALACYNLFSKGLEAKVTWLQDVQFWNRAPLFMLVEGLRVQVGEQYPMARLFNPTPPKYMTHKDVGDMFKYCLALAWGPAKPAEEYHTPSIESKKNEADKAKQTKMAAKAKQSLLKQATANSLGSKAKSAATRQSKAESAASAGSKRGRADDDQSPPAEPAAAGSGSRQSKKARTSQVEVDDGEKMEVDSVPGRVLRSNTKKKLMDAQGKQQADAQAAPVAGGSSNRKKNNKRG
ncbi:hypothetical protein R3P38DRAFT_2687207 [Favolaschia claudopus]|uniref:Fungal-type protein kinase domain-containing protein n=1 Tax=Favolaschia claudopus TaxID=2862362 RepID=A0AAW0D9K9_9AGAR